MKHKISFCACVRAVQSRRNEANGTNESKRLHNKRIGYLSKLRNWSLLYGLPSAFMISVCADTGAIVPPFCASFTHESQERREYLYVI